MAVYYRTIHPSTDEYQYVSDMVTSPDIHIEKIVKINNPISKEAYYQNKFSKQFCGPVTEKMLFHGTKKANLASICSNNFDWRLCNKYKYGKGVYFTHNAKYASNYCDEGPHKVLILSKVLIGRVFYARSAIVNPPKGFDTVQRDGTQIIVVKFDDHEFLPAYQIFYHLFDAVNDCDDSSSSDGYYY